MDLSLFLQHLEKIVTILAIIVGGIWAYFHFSKSRKYRIRLEPSISGKIITREQKTYVCVRLELKNAGEAVVEIEKKGSGFRLYSFLPDSIKGKSALAPKEHIRTYRIFGSHQWVESNETIVEEQLIAISGDQHFAFELEMRVISNKISFRTNCIVVADEK